MRDRKPMNFLLKLHLFVRASSVENSLLARPGTTRAVISGSGPTPSAECVKARGAPVASPTLKLAGSTCRTVP